MKRQFKVSVFSSLKIKKLHLRAIIVLWILAYIYICTRVKPTAASYLRSMSRAEMVVRRRPLSLLDSAVAIWYSSFSMENGLAMRRHFRSCMPKESLLNFILIQPQTGSFLDECLVWYFYTSEPQRLHSFIIIAYSLNKFCSVFSEIYSHLNTDTIACWS